MVYLLDVNVLLALFDPAHEHHRPAHAWYSGSRHWASCPLTENAVVHIASSPAYPGSPGGPSVIAGMLRTFQRQSQHTFWADEISLLDPELFLGLERITSKQITDVYLLALAASKEAKLATFDQSIPRHAVRGGDNALELIPL